MADWVSENGRRFCFVPKAESVTFETHQALYVASVTAPFGYSASQQDRVLLGEIRRLHLVT